MVLSAKMNTLIPNDNQDLTVDDLEYLINEIHAETGDRMNALDTNWTAAGWSGTKIPKGIVYGMELSYSGTADVSAGQCFVSGMRGTLAGTETIVAASLSVNDYIVARISQAGASPRVNPITGNPENMHQVFSTTFTYTAAPLADDVILNKVTAFNGLEPLFGDVAQTTFTEVLETLEIYPADAGGNLLRGTLGNKYHVRFHVETASVLTINETDDPSGMGFRYLDVLLAGDSVGVPTSTYNEIVAIVNGSTYFDAALTAGTGTNIPTTLQTTYATFTGMVGGDDYRKYYEVVTGSEALQKIDRFHTGDPFTKHISQKGRNTPTVTNPHGISLADMGVTGLQVEDHIEREHYKYACIPRTMSSNFLTSTINNQTVTIDAGAAGELCLIQGKAHSFSSDYTLTDPSSSFNLYEFYCTNDGNLSSREVSTYDSSTAVGGFTAMQNGDHIVLSIIDKDKSMDGVKILRLLVSGGGTVYQASLGNGPLVDVTDNTKAYYLYDTDDRHWVKVWRETEVMVDDDYRNNVTFTAFDDKAECPISLISWKGDQDEWGYNGVNELWVDKRPYGTADLLHDKNQTASERSPVKFTESIKGGYLYYVPATLDLLVKEFEIEYMGHTYRNESIQTFTMPANQTRYLMATFDERSNMTLSIEGSPALYENSICLGYCQSGPAAITSTREVYYGNTYNRSQEILKFDVSTEDDFWGALLTTRCLEGYISGGSNVVLDLRKDIVISSDNKISGASWERLTINGNGYKITYTGSSGSVDVLDKLKINNLQLDYSDTLFFCDGKPGYFNNCEIVRTTGTDPFAVQSDESFFFNDCDVRGTVEIQSTAGLVHFNNCELRLSVIGGYKAFFNNCSISGEDQTQLIEVSAIQVDFEVNFNNCFITACDNSFNANQQGRLRFNNCRVYNSGFTCNHDDFVLDFKGTSISNGSKITVTNGDLLMKNSHLEGADGTDWVSHLGNGNVLIDGCFLSRISLADSGAYYSISNTEVQYTIRAAGASKIYLDGVTYIYSVNDHGLVDHPSNQDLELFISNSMVYGNNRGVIYDSSAASTATVTIYLTNSHIERVAHQENILNACLYKFNLTGCYWKLHSYRMPTGSTNVWYTVVNSEWYDSIITIATPNTNPENLKISFLGSKLGHNNVSAYFSCATVSHKDCIIEVAADYLRSTPSGKLILKYDNTDLSNNTYWELD